MWWYLFLHGVVARVKDDVEMPSTVIGSAHALGSLLPTPLGVALKFAQGT